MSFLFDIDKAIQASAAFLRQAKDRRMTRLELLKLLYIADRESLRETGAPVTGDSAYAMKNGPVLTTIYDLVKSNGEAAQQSKWDTFLRSTGPRNVELIEDPGEGQLCEYESELISRIFQKYGSLGARLSDLTHEFEEYDRNKVSSSRQAIPLSHILAGVGNPITYEEAIEQRVEEEYFVSLFGG